MANTFAVNEKIMFSEAVPKVNGVKNNSNLHN
jgi:hypothetical protein